MYYAHSEKTYFKKVQSKCSQNPVFGITEPNKILYMHYLICKRKEENSIDSSEQAEKTKSPENAVFSGLLGVPDTIRTCDLQSRSLSLYPAELQAHLYKIVADSRPIAFRVGVPRFEGQKCQ